MKTRLATIELHKESMKFSAGHFAIFSATERERLHGHNYTVCVALTTEITDEGYSFDYRHYKKKIHHLCEQLNMIFLLPENSKHLRIEDEGECYGCYFNNEKIPFLKKDVLLLPVTNITVEELSNWFVEQLTQDTQDLLKHRIQKIIVKVYSAPGQSGSSMWV